MDDKKPKILQLLPAQGWWAEESVELEGVRRTQFYPLVAWALTDNLRGNLPVIGLITYDGYIDFPSDDSLVGYVFSPKKDPALG